MKRKIISILLVLVLCMSLAVTASATANTRFITDELGYLDEDSLEALNALASDIYAERGIGFFYAYTTEEDVLSFDIGSLVGDMGDYYVMVENDTSWTSYLGGNGAMIDVSTEDAIREIYDAAETYAGGVEDYLNAAAAYFSVDSAALQNTTLSADVVLLDEADLISNAEEASLSAKLQSISQAYGAQVSIITISSLESGNVDYYVEYLYDSMDLGYGENRDGVLLLICMDPREYRILSNGYAASAITDSDIDSIGSSIVSYLSDGEYNTAFDVFADECQFYLDGYINGFPFPLGTSLLTSLVIGLVAALIVTAILKSQLTSVQMQEEANAYTKQGSMSITKSQDIFLYRHVTKTERQTEDSSSSSSGSSRNVGGGSF